MRKQLAFYQERQVQPRRLNDSARFSLILWSRLCNWKEALVIVKPETLIGWQRKSFQLFWKGKSQAGRPRIPENIRNLIVQMAQENPTCGQARVAAELSVKLHRGSNAAEMQTHYRPLRVRKPLLRETRPGFDAHWSRDWPCPGSIRGALDDRPTLRLPPRLSPNSHRGVSHSPRGGSSGLFRSRTPRNRASTQ